MRTRFNHEFRVWLVLIFVALFNAMLFVGLDIIHGEISTIIIGTFLSFGIYILFLLVSIIFIVLKKSRAVMATYYALLGVLTTHIIYNLVYLIFDKKIIDNGVVILVDAMLIWFVTIIVFGLWYWVMDSGGPFARHNPDSRFRLDLLFPQHQTAVKGWEGWKPEFIDYLFFSFFTGTGFSPADILPLSKKVKTLMMIEAMISLTIIGMVVSRAITIL